MRPADRAWLTLAAGVLIWDVACPNDEMLSEASRRYAKSHPVAAYGVIASVALHLTSLLPKWVDPIHAIGVVLRKAKP
jgi:hypothetical protein